MILHFVIILWLATCTLASQENCIEKSDPCTGITEYNSYISCLDENRRQKRSLGCSTHHESCEYVDCQNCQEMCLIDCPECECPSSCRQCCSETCSTNLCCHKTCHNQCKTNYCRAECKKECKQRVVENGVGQDTGVGVNVVDNRNSSSLARHNITTIINLHNIINNTNLIDIPIKINNTNYNNITLKTSRGGQLTGGGYVNGDEGTDGSTDGSSNGDSEEKCCYVVGPRQCVKTNYYPFMKCFHYRYRKCGPYCVTTIVHAQPQNYCDDTGCHNKMFYIPQFQPRCHHQTAWPFVSCGGHQQYHNCHGCYDHQNVGNRHHHIRCSRCYNDGTEPYYRQGPVYQPPAYPGMYGGYPSMPLQYFPQMYNNIPAMPMANYPGYGYQPMPMPNYPGYGYPNYFGQQYYGGNPGIDNFNEEIIDAPKTENSELNLKSSYPVGSYIHETVIPAEHLIKSSSTLSDDQPSNSTEDNTNYASRYALISIDAAKPNHHNKREEKKDKKIKKRKDKMELDSEQAKKEEKLVTEDRLTTDKKSTLSP